MYFSAGSVTLQNFKDIKHAVSIGPRDYAQRTMVLLCRLGLTKRQYQIVRDMPAVMTKCEQQLAAALVKTVPKLPFSPCRRVAHELDKVVYEYSTIYVHGLKHGKVSGKFLHLISSCI